MRRPLRSSTAAFIVQMTVRSLYVCDVLHRRFHHLCGMLTPKRSQTGTGPTTLRPGTRHLPFLSGTVIRLCWSRSRPFRQTWRWLNRWLSWMLGGNCRLKESKRSTHQLQRRLRSLCEDRRDGRKSVAETLRGLGHCIRFEH